MSAVRTFQVAKDKNINVITNSIVQTLSSQGYNCIPQPMGPQACMITVSKDNDGIQNIIGLGIECKVTLNLNGTMLNVSIDSEWTNKILAIAIGWFFCLVPFITGIIGAANQNSLPEKIFTAINIATNPYGNPAPFQQAPFRQAPYQPAPFQQAPYQQTPYQQPPVVNPNPVQPPVQPPVQAPANEDNTLDETVRLHYPSEDQNS